MTPVVFVMMDGLRPKPLLDVRYTNLFTLRGRSSWTLPHPDWEGHCVDKIFE